MHVSYVFVLAIILLYVADSDEKSLKLRDYHCVCRYSNNGGLTDIFARTLLGSREHIEHHSEVELRSIVMKINKMRQLNRTPYLKTKI